MSIYQSLTVVCVILCASFSIASERGAALMKAGSAVVDVTPPVGLPMWGYGSRKDMLAEGVHDRLFAAAVVFQTGKTKLALVGLDLGRAPARKSMAIIRKDVRERAGVDHVMIVGSHTHHGPCLELEDVPPTSDYIVELNRKIADAIVEAAEAARPAKLAVARAETQYNRNRHTKIEPKPVDRELAVIRVDDMRGRPIATVVNFAAHPTTRPDMLLKYSSDFVGPLRERVESEIGGHCIFLQGACGDVSTDRGPLGTDEYGQALGDLVVKLSRSVEPTIPQDASIKVREEEFVFKTRVDLEDPVMYAVYSAAFFPDLVDSFVEEYRDGLRPSLSVALLNDSIGLVGGSGEFFSTHAIRLKQRSRLDHTLFLGYCNGYHQYFPTIEAAAEGGYGADPAVAPVEIGAGEQMINRALYHLYDMRSPFPGINR